MIPYELSDDEELRRLEVVCSWSDTELRKLLKFGSFVPGENDAIRESELMRIVNYGITAFIPRHYIADPNRSRRWSPDPSTLVDCPYWEHEIGNE